MCVKLAVLSLAPSLFSPPRVGFCRCEMAHLVCFFPPWSQQPWFLGESEAAAAPSLLLWALGRDMHHCVGIFWLPALCEDVPHSTSCT